MRYLKQLNEIKEALTMPTYSAGLAQARAYRLLQTNFNHALKPYNLTMTEWAMIGCIHDAGEIRLTELAAELDVKPPQVTVMIDKLASKGFVHTIMNEDDNRAKMVSLTPEGSELVPQAEADMRDFMRQYMKGANRSDLLAYLRVVTFLADKQT